MICTTEAGCDEVFTRVQVGPEQEQKLTVGDCSTWYCMLDEAGKVQLEQRVRTHKGLSRPASRPRNAMCV